MRLFIVLWIGLGQRLVTLLFGMCVARGPGGVEVPVRRVYADERNGLRPWRAAKIPWIIARRWWKELAVERCPA